MLDSDSRPQRGAIALIEMQQKGMVRVAGKFAIDIQKNVPQVRHAKSFAFECEKTKFINGIGNT